MIAGGAHLIVGYPRWQGYDGDQASVSFKLMTTSFEKEAGLVGRTPTAQNYRDPNSS